jgi:thermolysin
MQAEPKNKFYPINFHKKLEVTMKKIAVFLFLGLVLLSSGLFAIKAGSLSVMDPARPEKVADARSQKLVQAYLATEILKGRFIMTRSQRDKLTDIEHIRYQQVRSGLPVWGGEIVQHVKNGKVLNYDGEYFKIGALDVSPTLTPGQALDALRIFYNDKNLKEDSDQTRLVIFPLSDTDFRLAHKMIVRKAGQPLSNETAFVDAETGKVLLHFPNIIREELTIGLGVGKRGDSMKFPTTLSDNLYYLYDAAKVRPFTQKTWDMKHSYGQTIYISSTANNSWPSDDIVNVHTYIGYAYDFYYLFFGVKGIDNNNRTVNAYAHVFDIGQELYDNAFWNPSTDMYGQGFYFLDPYHSSDDCGAAIDIVGHEYSHAITTFHSDLTYYGESGSLNESFSDIFGTLIEFMFQPEGQGYNKADWIHGEDATAPFSYSQCRSQSDPNSNSQLKNAGYSSSFWYPDPCHISQKIPTLYDSKGKVIDSNNVHLNGTIFPHLFYLLANGGTNKVSRLAVTGIGIQKAAPIFYDAFANRMVASTNFLGAANALLNSAFTLYGSASTEYAQMKNALRAIGYTVN